MTVLNDRSTSIRDADHDVNLTMLLTIALVVLMILLFLRRLAATLIPSITLPVSLFGTFGRALDWSLAHRGAVLLAGLSTFALTASLYLTAPKSFFPQEDTGQINAAVDTPQNMSYEGRLQVLRQIEAVLRKDRAVTDIASKVDHDTTALYLTLAPRGERPATATLPLDAR